MQDVADELEDTWAALGPQRLTVPSNEYSDDPWSTSRFLVRAACFAWHAVDSDDQASIVWTCAVEMAISAWFAHSGLDSFAEVVVCLAHPAKRRLVVAGQPGGVFRYPVGLPDEAARAAIILLDNGMPPSGLESACLDAGIDVRAYLDLCTDSRMKDAIHSARKSLGEARTADLPSELP